MIIVKIGGGQNINWDYIAEDLALLSKKQKVIVIHGANFVRDEIARKLNQPTRTVVSPSGITSVLTDQKAMEIFLMAYAGLVNKQLVAKFQSYGLKAIGLSGIDGRLWQAKRKKEILIKENSKTKLLTNNFTGRVEEINISLINLLVNNGYLPVICPPAISFDQEIVNVDNDWAVAVMAGALKIKEIVSLFEAPGFLKNPDDEKALISKIDKRALNDCLIYAHGRMKKKILGAIKAFELGVKAIYWSDGRIKNPIQAALKGKGTIIS